MLTWLRKFVNDGKVDETFDSVATIQAHLEFRVWLEERIAGNLKEPMPVMTTCHAGCSVGKWLHGEGGGNCKDLDLVDALCRSCEEFYEAASNAVILMHMGHTEFARAALQDQKLSGASERFQLNVARLQQRCSASANPESA